MGNGNGKNLLPDCVMIPPIQRLLLGRVRWLLGIWDFAEGVFLFFTIRVMAATLSDIEVAERMD